MATRISAADPNKRVEVCTETLTKQAALKFCCLQDWPAVRCCHQCRFYRTFGLMKCVVVRAKNQSEYKFLMDLLDKLGMSSLPMSEEELEDHALLKMMKSVDRKKKVSRDAVMKKLKS